LTERAAIDIRDLEKGYEFPPFSVALDPAGLRRYLEAVEDTSEVYYEGAPAGRQEERTPVLAPPLGVVALALKALLDRLELPEGALHTAQELEMRRELPADARLACRARVAQRSELRGAVISVIEFEVAEEGGGESPAIVGRSTIMAAQAPATGGSA
jgi:hypothetical protein